jgi:Zn finger protein HypA/HybF involved in hydrogenase expression
MNNYQRQAILRCKKCKHEWEIHYQPGTAHMHPCPKCEQLQK